MAFNLTATLTLKADRSSIARAAADLRAGLRKQQIFVPVSVRIPKDTANKIVGLTSPLKRLDAKLRDVRRSANQAFQALKRLGTVTNVAASGTSKLNTQSTRTSRVVKQNTRAFKDATSQIEEFGRVSGLAIRRYAGFTIATTITFGFIRATTAAIRETIKFERELIKVAQVSDRAVQNLGLLRREIDFLATGLGVSSGSLIEVSRTLAQAGLRASETRAALRALALTELAPTFDNINQTTEGAIAILRQFGLQANQLEGILGSLNAVAGQFAVESGDLIAAVRRVGGVFAAAGEGAEFGGPERRLQELIALFTSVRATTRESAESIATGLRTIFTRIQRRSTIDALGELGIELTRINEQGQRVFVGAFEAVKRLNEGLRNLPAGATTFNQILEQLGGFRQISKTIPLILQFETAQKALNAAQEGTNSLIEDAQVALEGLGVRLDQTRERFLKLIRDIVLSREFKVAANFVLDLADAFIRLADSLRPLIPLLTAVVTIRGFGTLAQFGRGFRRGAGSVRRNQGGPIQRFQDGGQTRFRDALLTPGELVILPDEVKKIGAQTLERLNSAKQIFKVPGVGSTDSVQQTLPVGSFVLRKDATDLLKENDIIKRNRGGIIPRFGSGGRIRRRLQEGGLLPGGFEFSTTSFDVLITTLVAGLALFGRNIVAANRGIRTFREVLQRANAQNFRQRVGATRVAARIGLQEAGLPVRGQAGRQTFGRLGLFGGAVGLAVGGLRPQTAFGQAAAGGVSGGLLAGGGAALLGAGPVGAAIIGTLGAVDGALKALRQSIEEQRLEDLRNATDDLASSFRDLQENNIDFNELNRDLGQFIDALAQGTREAERARRFSLAGAAPFVGLGLSPFAAATSLDPFEGTTPRGRAAAADQLGIIGNLGNVFRQLGFAGIDSAGRARQEFREARRAGLTGDVNEVIRGLEEQIPNIERALVEEFKRGRQISQINPRFLQVLGIQDELAQRRIRERLIRRPDLDLATVLEQETQEAGLRAALAFKRTFDIEQTLENTTQQLDFFSERLEIISAVAQRAGEEAQRFQNRRFRIEQGLTTAPTTGAVSTRISTLLGNLRAATPREFERSLEQIQNITGGGFPDLEGTFRGLQNLQQAFPAILQRAAAGPIGGREEALREGIRGVVPEGALRERLLAGISEIFGRRGANISIEEFAREFNIDQLSQGLLQQLTQTFANISSEFESASQDFINALERASNLTRQANQAFDAATDIRLRSDIQQIRLRGGRPSLTELQAPFITRQRTLARRGGLFGDDLDPRTIAEAISRAQATVSFRQRELDVAIERGDAEDVELFARGLAASQERLGALNQALQNLANSTERQTNIVNQLNQLQQRRQTRGSFIDRFFGGGVAGRAQLVREVAGGRALLEGGAISPRGEIARQQLAGLRQIQELARAAGNERLLQRIERTFDRLLGQTPLAGNRLIRQGLLGLPGEERDLRRRLEQREEERAQANEEIGRFRRRAAEGQAGEAVREFRARSDTLNELRQIDQSFNNAATQIGTASTQLSQNVTAVAEQLSNVNIPSEITFAGTINEGQPIVVSLAGQDALTTRITDEVATRVDELIRERINERTIPNLLS